MIGSRILWFVPGSSACLGDNPAMAGSLVRHVRVSPESACSMRSSHSAGSCFTGSPPQLAVLAPVHLSRSSGILHSSARRSSLCRSGLCFLISWEGRSHLGHLGRLLAGRRWQSKRGFAGRVQASLFGVGAPEALVIGIVALVVFGPKGLAEVARTLGKSLKAFQPTIQELQQISREFKNTLEQEIGLEELRNPPRPTNTPPTYQPSQPARLQNGTPEGREFPSEEYVKAANPDDTSPEAEVAAPSSSAPSVTAADEISQDAVATRDKSLKEES